MAPTRSSLAPARATARSGAKASRRRRRRCKACVPRARARSLASETPRRATPSAFMLLKRAASVKAKLNSEGSLLTRWAAAMPARRLQPDRLARADASGPCAPRQCRASWRRSRLRSSPASLRQKPAALAMPASAPHASKLRTSDSRLASRALSSSISTRARAETSSNCSRNLWFSVRKASESHSMTRSSLTCSWHCCHSHHGSQPILRTAETQAPRSSFSASRCRTCRSRTRCATWRHSENRACAALCARAPVH
mmetsp:Transcript_40559/g.108216  ORF Transcript_40559/g.108216 Transcript_40559/m.108216 type:complete len:255 (-) Transcript_40559:282-1046(-)